MVGGLVAAALDEVSGSGPPKLVLGSQTRLRALTSGPAGEWKLFHDWYFPSLSIGYGLTTHSLYSSHLHVGKASGAVPD